jgi:flagellar biosynthesis regulator FlbT
MKTITEKPKAEGDCSPAPPSDSIILNVGDSCFERARKILKRANLIDGVGLADRMAEALEAYRKLDHNAATQLAAEGYRSAVEQGLLD